MSDNESEVSTAKTKKDTFNAMLKKLKNMKVANNGKSGNIDDDVRDKVFDILIDVFVSTKYDFIVKLIKEYEISNDDIAEFIVADIEEGIYQVANGNKSEYYRNARKIKANLTHTENAKYVVEKVFMFHTKKELCVYVDAGKESFDPIKLGGMTTWELYPEKSLWRREQLEEEERLKKEFHKKKMEKFKKGMLTCGKCKESMVEFYLKQTRSADEPMTQFCTCINCGHRWKM